MALFCLAETSAQVNRPPQRHRVSYAKDSIFRKPAVQRTVQPSIFARAMGTTSGCNLLCSPLPAKFLSLKAERKSETRVVVKWETANEMNMTGYEVERSLGNATQFEKTGFVPATGETNGSFSYEFPDANDFSGISYYRIKQLDRDGKYSYSKNVAVKGYSKSEGLEIFPNPVQNELQVVITVTNGGPVAIHLLDVNGRLVQQHQRVLSKGGNMFTLSTTALPAGTYFLRTVTPSEKPFSLLFIKK